MRLITLRNDRKKGCIQTHIHKTRAPEAVFLVRLGASSFPARHKLYGKTKQRTSFLPGNELVPSLTKNTASVNATRLNEKRLRKFKLR